jgi:NitT/TauT family transport system substrate-binding protein
MPWVAIVFNSSVWPSGSRLGDLSGRDRAAGAAAIADDDGLPERVRQLGADQPCHAIRRAAGRHGDDELDRAVRIARLGARNARMRKDKSRDNHQKAWQTSHFGSPNRSTTPLPPPECPLHIKLSENFRAVFYGPFYATHALGFYTDEGVEVELLNSPAPAAAAAGLLDGSIDIAWGGPMRVMKARDLDPHSPLVCFCEVAGRDPFFLVGKGDPSSFRLADLTRLKVGTVSEVDTPWLCLQHDLRLEGIDPDKVERVTGRTMAQNLEALRAGELDVAQMFEPYVSMALREGAGEILYAASSRGPTGYTTFLASRDSVRRNRAAFDAMVRATRRTLTWVAEHSAADLVDAVAPYYTHVPRDILTSAHQRYRDAGLWSRTPDVSRQGFTRLADSLQSGGFVSRPHAYEDCVEQSLT